jgi:hypothetical protein
MMTMNMIIRGPNGAYTAHKTALPYVPLVAAFEYDQMFIEMVRARTGVVVPYPATTLHSSLFVHSKYRRDEVYTHEAGRSRYLGDLVAISPVVDRKDAKGRELLYVTEELVDTDLINASRKNTQLGGQGGPPLLGQYEEDVDYNPTLAVLNFLPSGPSFKFFQFDPSVYVPIPLSQSADMRVDFEFALWYNLGIRIRESQFRPDEMVIYNKIKFGDSIEYWNNIESTAFRITPKLLGFLITGFDYGYEDESEAEVMTDECWVQDSV